MFPLGLHRVLEPAGVLPQAAWRLDARPEIWPDEVRVAVQRLNLDAASFRQLREASHDDAGAPDPGAVRAAVLDIVARRGKMHNPVTGSGGMLIGVVEAVGPDSPLGLSPGDRIATLVSLSLTPLVITDGLAIEVTATITRVGRRSRDVAFEARVLCRADPERGPSAARVLPDPIVVVTATGTVVVPPDDGTL